MRGFTLRRSSSVLCASRTRRCASSSQRALPAGALEVGVDVELDVELVVGALRVPVFASVCIGLSARAGEVRVAGSD